MFSEDFLGLTESQLQFLELPVEPPTSFRQLHLVIQCLPSQQLELQLKQLELHFRESRDFLYLSDAQDSIELHHQICLGTH
jgi:hypothetical protein